MVPQLDDVSAVLLGRVTLGVFTITGPTVALAEWGLLPRETLIVGAPAIAAALLLDTFLYNEFLLGTPTWFLWAEIYAFLYVQAVVLGTVAYTLEPYWTEHVAIGR
jgi:cellulose synthase/poly-beta-1,6-N-acetylglucosamine synthase-like glycosyltransferase